MIRDCALLHVILFMFCGCSSAAPLRTGKEGWQALQVEVVNADEHLGHNISEGGGHSVWCDGCRMRILATGEPFVIYWVNDAIKDTPFRFGQGRRYTVWFAGKIEKGVMGYEGKCIDIGQVVKLKKMDQRTSNQPLQAPADRRT